jgi:hypothetical protein
VKLEDARGANLVTKADANSAFKAESWVTDDATIGKEVKCGNSLVVDSAKPEFTGEKLLLMDQLLN